MGGRSAMGGGLQWGEGLQYNTGSQLWSWFLYCHATVRRYLYNNGIPGIPSTIFIIYAETVCWSAEYKADISRVLNA